MIPRIQLLAILGSIFLLLLVEELIRRRQLEEKYALVWLLTCIFFLLCSINRGIIEFLARHTGIVTPANFLFLLAFFFLVLICLSLTIVISRENQRHRRFAQELTLLRFDLEEIKKRTGPGEDGGKGALTA